MTLVPSAGAILDDALPPLISYDAQQKEINLLEKTLTKKVIFINLLKELENHKDEYIYYKTDHHWTSLGAFYGWQEVSAIMGISPPLLNEINLTDLHVKFFGSLYSQSGYPFSDADTIMAYDWEDKKQVRVFFEDQKKKLIPYTIKTNCMKKINISFS